MRQRTAWLTVDILKTALLLGLIAWIGGSFFETRYQLVAQAEGFHDVQQAQEARIADLEEIRQRTVEDLRRASQSLATFRQDMVQQLENLSADYAGVVELVDSRTGELQRRLNAGIERIEGEAWCRTIEVEERVENLQESIHRSPIDMKRRMIYPVVQLRGNGTVGSGVVICSERNDTLGVAPTYVVTAYHVIEEILGGDMETGIVEELRFLNPRTDQLFSEAHEARIVTARPQSDIALLRIDLDEPWPYVARLASPEVTDRVEIFDRVYAVGCPLGNKPLPTVGEISSQEKMVEDQIFWMINAPTFFGNSGGGVFLVDSGELVGISSMIYTYGKRNPMVVPHMGLFVPLETVRLWLREEGLDPLARGESPKLVQVESASVTTD